MGNINTVAGVIPSMQLGVTYAHEHLITHPPQFVVNEDPDLCMNDIEKAVTKKNYMDIEDLEVYKKLCQLHIEVCDLTHTWP